MSKVYNTKKIRFLTDNDTPKPEQIHSSSTTDLPRKILLMHTRNNEYILKHFRRTIEEKLSYLTESSE